MVLTAMRHKRTGTCLIRGLLFTADLGGVALLLIPQN
jgi:hypothetical protein